tara:strand:+ start:1970 stop:3394 length:1425 start_codon:yes stop_codon:yes gene_type:complete
MWISQLQLQKFRSVTNNLEKPIVLLSLAIEGIKNKLVWKKYMSLVEGNILLVIYGPVDVDLDAKNVIFLKTNDIFKYYGWCDASLVYLLMDALQQTEYLDPAYIFVISGTCIPLQKTYYIKSQTPTLLETQWIHMDNTTFKTILDVSKNKELLFQNLRIWSLHTNVCPDELWFQSKKEMFPDMDVTIYSPSVMSFRSFETETSPFTFTNIHDETFLRLFTTVKNDEVSTFASIKTNLKKLMKIIGSRNSSPIYIGDAFYMRNKSIANLITFKAMVVTTSGEFPDGLYKCIDIHENRIISVFVDTNEEYKFHITEQVMKKCFFRKVDLNTDDQKILVNLLNDYFWNKYDGPVEPYEPIFETNTFNVDSFANTVMLDIAKEYIIESGVHKIKKYDNFPVIISSSLLKLEEYFKGTYNLEPIDLFPLLSLPFNITINGKVIALEHDGDWIEVYRKLRTESYEDFLESVKSLNIKLVE